MIDDVLDAARRDFVCEALDVAAPFLGWTIRHLQEGRDDRAIATFDKLLATVREAAAELKPIKDKLAGEKIAAETAAEFRAQRPAPRLSAKANAA